MARRSRSAVLQKTGHDHLGRVPLWSMSERSLRKCREHWHMVERSRRSKREPFTWEEPTRGLGTAEDVQGYAHL